MALKKYKGLVFLILFTCAFLICSVEGDALNFFNYDYYPGDEFKFSSMFPPNFGADKAFMTHYGYVSTREMDGLKGPVKLIKYGEVKERSMGKLVINEDNLSFEIQYNSKGQKTYEGYGYEFYYENNKVVEKRIGNLPTGDSSWSQCRQWKYSYNDKGQLVFVKFIDYEGSSEEDPNWTKTITYDDKGRLKEVATKTNKDISNAVFVYDNKGRVSKIYTQDKNGIDMGLTELKYDANGFLINPEHQYIYDKYGRVIYENNDEKITYEYDSKGYLVKRVETDYRGTVVFTYSYKYDPKGNWIQRETFRSGKSDKVEARFIYYYE